MTWTDSIWTNPSSVVMPAVEMKSRTYSSYFVRVPGARWAATKFRISASRGPSRAFAGYSGWPGGWKAGSGGEAADSGSMDPLSAKDAQGLERQSSEIDISEGWSG